MRLVTNVSRLVRDGYRDLLAIASLGVLTVLFFWRLLFTGGVWRPAGGGDLAGFLYPTYHFAAVSLKGGEIPLWNPYLYAGAPHVADIQSGVFYPVNLLAFLLNRNVTYRLMEMLSVFHFFLAGASTYLALRFLKPAADSDGQRGPISRPAAMLGAVALMFSDLFVIHFGNTNLIAAAAWLPLTFLGAYRALNGRSVPWAVLGGLSLGMAALAGHAQPLQFMILIVGLYTLYHLIAERQQGLPGALRAVGLAGLVGLVGFGLAALSLLPALEMVGHTRRANLTYAAAAQYSLPPQALIGLLVPSFFGRGVDGFWGSWPRVEVGYLGVLPLALAILVVATRWREHLVRFLGGLAVLSLLLALGINGPLHRWVYRLVPGFQNLRVPARFIYVMDFALAGLAALGLDALLRRQDELPNLTRAVAGAGLVLAAAVGTTAVLLLDRYQPTPERTTRALGGMAIFAGLLAAAVALIVARGRGWLRAAPFAGLCVALVAADVIGLGSGVDVGYQDPTANFHRPEIVKFLRSDPSLYRIEVRPEVWGWWSPDAALVHGVQDAGGIYNPLRLSDYQLYWESLTDRSTPLYDFLNVKYVLAPKDFALPWDKFIPVFDGDPHVNAYLNREALPRTSILHEAQIVEDQEAAWRAIHRTGFDPAHTVVVEGGQPVWDTTTTSDRLSVEAYGLNEVRLTAETDSPGYLVVSDTYYPGWQAYVDGEKAALRRANYAFRAVHVPAGRHRVRMVFSPLSWRVGAAISAATAAALIGFAAVRVGVRARGGGENV